MADSNTPTPSLADRITTSKPLDGSSSSFNPTNSWADEVASPTGPRRSENSLAAAQVDGAGGPQQGSAIEEVEHEVEVIDSYSNESNPLHSVSSFEELGIHADILKGLYALNFKKPSKIQEKALPILIGSVPRNMIAQSQSGTGKTAAFVITILTRLDHTKPNSPQALCLAPSRELARQIEGVVKSIGRFIPDLTIQAAIPGEVQRNAKVEAMVVVGTPGTVMDLIKRRQLDTTHLKVLCLDEADNMLDQQGLGDQCMRLRQMIPNVSQSLLFSATFPDPVIQYANLFSPNAISLRLKKNDQTVAGITQMYMDVSSDQDKFDTLARVFGILGTSQSIIFCKRRDTASAISQRLQADGHKVAALHGAFDGTERDQLLDNFRSSVVKILITTNVLARGIDVSAVSMVINWDIPTKGRNDEEADPETYLHRIGRTGRFGRVGVSISFVHDRKSYQALSAIAAHFQIELKKIDQADWDEAEVDMKRVIKESQIRAATQSTT